MINVLLPDPEVWPTLGWVSHWVTHSVTHSVILLSKLLIIMQTLQSPILPVVYWLVSWLYSVTLDLSDNDSSHLDFNQEGYKDLDGQEGSGTTSFTGLVLNEHSIQAKLFFFVGCTFKTSQFYSDKNNIL